ncbi:MAG: PHP domain-containing protein [Rhodoplanes sp.]
MSAYAELAVSTNFSFLRGASHPEELVMQAKAQGLSGLGVADRNSVAGVVRAHQAAKEHGVRLAVGARLVFADATPDILAYPQDRVGWAQLTRLLTLGKRRAEKGACTLFFDDLLAHAAGLNLIVFLDEMPAADNISSCAGSTRASTPSLPSPASGGGSRAQRGGRGKKFAVAMTTETMTARHSPRNDDYILARLREAAPGSVWLGASILYRGDDARRLARLAELAVTAKVPLIAVGDVLYHAPERRALQDVVTCIREHLTLDNAGRRLEANAERHLKSADEMARLFRARPQAVTETQRFLDRCRFSLDELAYAYPDEIREGFATPQDALIAFAEEGARRRYPHGVPANVRHALDHEYALIGALGYAPYFLTVHDIVRFARAQGILCQGRGSAANSAVCYCLGVTEVDPERADLLFERFVSAERREPPDIDVDFEHERREEVIQYIYRRYGRERAGLAATVICYRGRSAIREVGKVFGLSDDAIGALAGTLWGWSAEAISNEHARRVGFDPADPRLAKVLALARELIGFPRHLSQHVGGFVITRGRLDELVPIENAAMEERTVIEWDKDDLDTLRILKIDVLGLGMLSCLRRSLDLLQKHYPACFASPLEEETDQSRRASVHRERSDLDPNEDFLKQPPPLRGRSDRAAIREGGDPDATQRGVTPVPNPPPQGGREQEEKRGPKGPQQAPFPSPLAGEGGETERNEVEPGEGESRKRGASSLPPHPPRFPGPSPGSLGTLSREGRGKELESRLDLSVIPPEDPAVYRMLSRADSVGVFQVESRAQMTMLPRLRPRTFYDLVIEVAIVRPGPIQGDMVHPYLRRRQGLEEVHFPSPSPAHGPPDELHQVLGKTLGVPLFQEQAMRIAIVAAGFTPSEADQLRRAMATFRRVGTIKYFRTKLIEGMAARGYPRDFAERCFNQIEGFGEYGFPESHAASFALLGYASAWIKCRYPDVFAAALLNSQPMGFYAPAQIVRDAQEHGVEVRPVDVNFSDWDNTLEACERPLSDVIPGEPEGRDPESKTQISEHGFRARGLAPAPRNDGFGGATNNPTSDRSLQGERKQQLAQASFTSPLEGEVDRRRLNGVDREGGDVEAIAKESTPLPGPSPQGGREQHFASGASDGQSPRLHPRHAEMQDDIRATHAARLGLRQISGFSEDDARAIERARGAGFDSVRDLWLRTKLSPAVLERLAQADAFRSVGLDRRKALWAVRALRRAGDKDDLPLFARVQTPELEPDVALPPMRLGEHVVADYRHLHLSLKAHPASFLRGDLDRRGIVRNERLAAIPSGRRVSVAGIVLVRQRPGTAKGVIFMTLEDETGVANAIVWPQVFETYRPIVLGARLVSVSGKLQNEFGVIHVVADRLDDLTPLLQRLAADAGCIEALARCDEFKRPIPEGRIPLRAGSSLAALLREEPQFSDEFALAAKARSALPKGRDFR